MYLRLFVFFSATFKGTSYFGLYLLEFLFFAMLLYIIAFFKFTFSVHDLPFFTHVSLLFYFFIQSICTILHDVCRAFHQHFECFYFINFVLPFFRHCSVHIFTTGENLVRVVVNQILVLLQQVGFTGDFTVRVGGEERLWKEYPGKVGETNQYR